MNKKDTGYARIAAAPNLLDAYQLQLSGEQRKVWDAFLITTSGRAEFPYRPGSVPCAPPDIEERLRLPREELKRRRSELRRIYDMRTAPLLVAGPPGQDATVVREAPTPEAAQAAHEELTAEAIEQDRQLADLEKHAARDLYRDELRYRAALNLQDFFDRLQQGSGAALCGRHGNMAAQLENISHILRIGPVRFDLINSTATVDHGTGTVFVDVRVASKKTGLQGRSMQEKRRILEDQREAIVALIGPDLCKPRMAGTLLGRLEQKCRSIPGYIPARWEDFMAHVFNNKNHHLYSKIHQSYRDPGPPPSGVKGAK